MNSPSVSQILKNEPDHEYHAKREYISSSSVVHMMKSPLHFQHAFAAAPIEATDAMDIGTFIHQILLLQDIEKFVARPLNERGELVRSNSKDYAAFLAANVGKTPIHPDLYAQAMGILTAALRHPRFSSAIDHSETEVSYYGMDHETGLKIKARPDIIAKDLSFMIDVKSTADITRFDKQIFSLGYDLRLAHYIQTIFSVTGSYVPNIYFFAIESKPPFASRMYRLSFTALTAAKNDWRQHMSQISACKADNVWPGFSEDVVEVDRPKFHTGATEVNFEEAM